MSGREIKNARIKETSIRWEDHGIFTIYLTLDYGGGQQAFGGYTFDSYDAVQKKRIAVTGHAVEYIKAVMRVAGVSSWEDLKGKYVRADADHGKVYRIGNLLEDDWFDPQELFKDTYK